MNLRKALLEADIRGKTLFNEPMSRHTSFAVGGSAEVFVTPSDMDDLRRLLSITRETKAGMFVLGAGANILVSDSGISGTVDIEIAEVVALCVVIIEMIAHIGIDDFEIDGLRSGDTKKIVEIGRVVFLAIGSDQPVIIEVDAGDLVVRMREIDAGTDVAGDPRDIGVGRRSRHHAEKRIARSYIDNRAVSRDDLTTQKDIGSVEDQRARSVGEVDRPVAHELPAPR